MYLAPFVMNRYLEDTLRLYSYPVPQSLSPVVLASIGDFCLNLLLFFLLLCVFLPFKNAVFSIDFCCSKLSAGALQSPEQWAAIELVLCPSQTKYSVYFLFSGQYVRVFAQVLLGRPFLNLRAPWNFFTLIINQSLCWLESGSETVV